MISHSQYASLPVKSVRFRFEGLAERAAWAAAVRAAELGSPKRVSARPFHREDARRLTRQDIPAIPPQFREPLTAGECVEVLALGEALARYYRDEGRVHHAVLAGASWEAIAAATGTSPAEARKAYREWAGKQLRIRLGKPGLSDGLSEAEYAAALAAAAVPAPGGGESR